MSWEIWQANSYGRYNHPDDKIGNRSIRRVIGWGRSGTDENALRFETIKPGAVPGNVTRSLAPCNVVIFARGMLVHAYTRIYFDDEAAMPMTGAIIDQKQGAAADVNRPARERDGKVVYLRHTAAGGNETVFFDM